MPFDPSRPFAVAEARAAGVTSNELRGPGYRSLFHGVYVAADARIDDELLARAAVVATGGRGIVAGAWAARLMGGIVPHDPDATVRIPEGMRLRRKGIRAVHGLPDRVVSLRGLRTTSPEQTFLDLADRLDLVDLVVLGDSLVHRHRTTPEGLVRAASTWRGRGSRHARRAAALVRRGAESRPETRLWLLLVLAGLPEPALQLEIVNAWGRVERRHDLAYEEIRVALEYDGRHHAESTAQWERDIDRRERSERDGWLVLTVTAARLGRPGELLASIAEACRARGMWVSVHGDEWRRHFPEWERYWT